MNINAYVRPIIGLSIIAIPICFWTSAFSAPQKNITPRYLVSVLHGFKEGVIITDLNDQGEVIGEEDLLDTARFGSRSFIWQEGRKKDLGSFANYKYVSAGSINNQRWIVGSAYDGNVNDPEESNPASRAFLWRDGKFTILSTLSGKTSSANDINEKGEIVGTVDKRDGTYHACVWRDNKIIDLGTLGGKNSIAGAINNQGDIVGYSETKAGYDRAFLWKDGKMQDIGTLGGKNSRAHAINDKGAVVGTADTVSGASHAFLWEDGKMQDLGTLGGESSSASGINDQGHIVGMADSTAFHSYGWGLPATYFFLYQNNKMHDLNILLPKSSEWKFEGNIGPAINDKGQIAGVGLRNGESRGFILTPLPSR